MGAKIGRPQSACARQPEQARRPHALWVPATAPEWPSERTRSGAEQRARRTAVAVVAAVQARTRALAIRKHPRRRAVRGTQQTGGQGHPGRTCGERLVVLRQFVSATYFEVPFFVSASFSALFSASFLRMSLAFSIRNFPAASTSLQLLFLAPGVLGMVVSLRLGNLIFT